jgi:putative transposase
MVSPSSRRRAAKYLVEEGLSNAAQACRALGLARSSYYLAGQKGLSSQKLERKIIALSEEHPRYGYRRITALMRRKGKPINAKQVQRVRRQAGLVDWDRLLKNGFEHNVPTRSGVGICSTTRQSMAEAFGS